MEDTVTLNEAVGGKYDALACSIIKRFGVSLSDDVVSDCLQEARLIILQKYDGYDTSRGASFTTYIYSHIYRVIHTYLIKNYFKIAYTRSNGKLKNNGNIADLDAPFSINSATTLLDIVPSCDNFDNIEASLLLSKIENLEDYKLIKSYYFDGKNCVEIAKESGFSRRYIERKKNNIINKLKQQVGV